tara:strand:+ start:151 stop:501 length:351 start_codon:yes stop_codon:yes gene_type:complete
LENSLSTERCCIPFPSKEEAKKVIDKLAEAGCCHSGNMSLHQAFTMHAGAVQGITTSPSGQCSFYLDASVLNNSTLKKVPPTSLVPEVIEDYKARIKYGYDGYRKHLSIETIRNDF